MKVEINRKFESNSRRWMHETIERRENKVRKGWLFQTLPYHRFHKEQNKRYFNVK